MAINPSPRWQTVVFLLLSKIASDTPFSRKQLINPRNTELAARFAEMVGDPTPPEKVKLTLGKTLDLLEKQQYLQTTADGNLQLSEAGHQRLAQELQAAKEKIAASFPATTSTAQQPQ
ncbi:MAG: hypothetical protein AB7T15_09090 [Desulfuromonas sp.]